MRRFAFWLRYLLGTARWDTGITPPEVVALIEGEHLPPGRAIDLGCGTGTNAIYLAQQGWEVVGVDFVRRAVRAARRKARRAALSGRVRFLAGDVTRLDSLDLDGPFDLALDIGCLHSLPPASREGYAQSVGRLVRPGGVFMLYMFRPTPERPLGLEPDGVEALFAPEFEVSSASLGQDSAAQADSAWYRLTRRESSR